MRRFSEFSEFLLTKFGKCSSQETLAPEAVTLCVETLVVVGAVADVIAGGTSRGSLVDGAAAVRTRDPRVAREDVRRRDNVLKLRRRRLVVALETRAQGAGGCTVDVGKSVGVDKAQSAFNEGVPLVVVAPLIVAFGGGEQQASSSVRAGPEVVDGDVHESLAVGPWRAVLGVRARRVVEELLERRDLARQNGCQGQGGECSARRVRRVRQDVQGFGDRYGGRRLRLAPKHQGKHQDGEARRNHSSKHRVVETRV